MSKQSEIDAANAAFSLLTDEQKQQLENADSLAAANSLLEQAQAARTAAQSLAEEIFLSNSYMFKHPESIVLKRAWYSNMLGRHNFTFEVEAKNGLGIMETSYYGNEFSSASITNTPIASTLDELDLIGNKFFDEGNIKAMDETEKGYGVRLNVESIMTYLRRNR